MSMTHWGTGNIFPKRIVKQPDFEPLVVLRQASTDARFPIHLRPFSPSAGSVPFRGQFSHRPLLLGVLCYDRGSTQCLVPAVTYGMEY